MDKEIRKEVISILVDNQANVRTRVSSLFGRRGFKIDSLTVSATNDPKLSRITVVFTGTEQGLHQIITQTAKLEVVKKIFTLDKNDSIYRELPVSYTHLTRQIYYDLVVRSRFPYIDDSITYLRREIHFRTGKALRRIFKGEVRLRMLHRVFLHQCRPIGSYFDDLRFFFREYLFTLSQ